LLDYEPWPIDIRMAFGGRSLADLTATLTPAADEALTGELVPLLTALGPPPQVTAAATRLC